MTGLEAEVYWFRVYVLQSLKTTQLHKRVKPNCGHTSIALRENNGILFLVASLHNFHEGEQRNEIFDYVLYTKLQVNGELVKDVAQIQA